MTEHDAAQHRRRWWILGVIALAQLMVVLDATIVNIALPSAQQDLGFTDADRQWVVTAYALSFGALLLLGGRLGDLFGRKNVFVVGLLGFAAASALGGAATSFAMLVGARGLQGAFGALLAPAALSLLSTTFTAAHERARAFAIYGAIAGAGGAIGLLLGGVLTEYLSWRWSMYVNVLFAIPAAAGAIVLIARPLRTARPKLDIPGTLAATTGLFSLVYGLSHAESAGWDDPVTLGFLAAGALLLGAFVLIESRVAGPLLPLRVVRDRMRGGAYASVGIVGAGMFGVFLFLTYYLQGTLGMSPIQTGLAFLPMVGILVVVAQIATMRVAPRTGPRPLIPTGMLLAAGGMVLLAQLDISSTYLTGVLPGLLVLGAGMGMIFAPAMMAATSRVAPADAGVASAMVNTTQQIGGSIGTALLSTIASSAVTASIASNGTSTAAQAAAQIAGYTTAFWWAAAIFAAGAAVSALLLPRGVPATSPAAEPVLAH